MSFPESKKIIHSCYAQRVILLRARMPDNLSFSIASEVPLQPIDSGLICRPVVTARVHAYIGIPEATVTLTPQRGMARDPLPDCRAALGSRSLADVEVLGYYCRRHRDAFGHHQCPRA